MLLLALASPAQAGCTRGTEAEPPLCPTHLPALRSVTITATGARAYAEPDGPRSCAPFRPSMTQVRRFLVIARTTDARSADATLDRSPCFAGGVARFADRRTAVWRIEQLGMGTLTFAGRPPMLLYCRTCRARPFIR